MEGDAVVVDPKKVVVLIGVNDDANGVLIFESFGNDPAGGKSVIPGIYGPMGHGVRFIHIIHTYQLSVLHSFYNY